MKKLKSFFNLVKSVDLFCTTQFWRYKSQEGYTSFFGGLISTFSFIMVGLVFIDNSIECLNKTNISSTVSQKILENPTLLNISTYPQGKFMAAIQVPGLRNKNPQIKYFDFKYYQFINQVDEITGQFIRQQYIYYDFQPCTLAHWQGYPQILEDIKLLNLNNMLCMQMNSTILVGGKYTSCKIMQFMFGIRYPRCKNLKNFTRCATQDQYREFFKNSADSRLQLYFINSQITPDKPQYIKYFLDDKYSAYFSQTKSTAVNIYLQDYIIKTDQSIFFTNNVITQSGFLVDQNPRVQPSNTIYIPGQIALLGQLIFSKSYISKTVERQFLKFQDVFSLAGGFFGIFSVVFFFVKSYNNIAYQISLVSKLFQPVDVQEKEVLKNYNFLSYLKRSSLNLLKKLKLTIKWEQTIKCSKYEIQIKKQLDVRYLVKRLLFLETAVSIIMDDDSIKGLRSRTKPSLTEAKKIRKSYNLDKQNKKKRQQENQNDSSPEGSEQDDESVQNIQETKKEQIDQQCETDKNKEILCKNQPQPKNAQTLVSQQIKNAQEQKNKCKDKRQIRFVSARCQMDNQSMKVQILLPNSKNQSSNFRNSLPNLRNESSNLENQSNVILSIQKNHKNSSQNYPHQKRTKIFKLIGNIIKSTDIFFVTQLFRFKYNATYRTFFGGLISILIIIITLIISYGKIIESLNKSSVDSTVSKSFSTDPDQLIISTVPKGNFMAAINSDQIQINHPQFQYFEFQIQNNMSYYDQETNQWRENIIRYPLQSCTEDHWSPFPELGESLKIMPPNNLLCFPKGITLNLKGKSKSKENFMIDVVIKKCKEDSNLNRLCDLNETQKFLQEDFVYVTLIFTNTLINPQQSKYISYYLHDLAYFQIQSQNFNKVEVFFDDFKIQTDQSIYPWAQTVTESGSIVTANPIVKTDLNKDNPDEYGRLSLRRSSKSSYYTRSFKKIDQVFSFIGGIFGIIVASFFFISSYNIVAYKISIGHKLFNCHKNRRKYFKTYNIFKFFIQIVYSFLTAIGFKPNWESIIQYEKCQLQIQKQLDVVEVLKKIIIYEKAIQLTLQNFEIQGLHLRQNLTYDETKNLRKFFKRRRKQYTTRLYLKNGQRGYGTTKETLGSNVLNPNSGSLNSSEIKQVSFLGCQLQKIEGKDANERDKKITSIRDCLYEQEQEQSNYFSDDSDSSQSQKDERSKTSLAIKGLNDQADWMSKFRTRAEKTIREGEKEDIYKLKGKEFKIFDVIQEKQSDIQ